MVKVDKAAYKVDKEVVRQGGKGGQGKIQGGKLLGREEARVVN